MPTLIARYAPNVATHAYQFRNKYKLRCHFLISAPQHRTLSSQTSLRYHTYLLSPICPHWYVPLPLFNDNLTSHISVTPNRLIGASVVFYMPHCPIDSNCSLTHDPPDTRPQSYQVEYHNWIVFFILFLTNSERELVEPLSNILHSLPSLCNPFGQTGMVHFYSSMILWYYAYNIFANKEFNFMCGDYYLWTIDLWDQCASLQTHCASVPVINAPHSRIYLSPLTHGN